MQLNAREDLIGGFGPNDHDNSFILVTRETEEVHSGPDISPIQGQGY